MEHLVYCGVGSNMGDRETTLSQAADVLNAHPSIKVLRKSRVHETDAVGGPPQGPYLNAVWELETDLSPHELIDFFQGVEVRYGCDRRREIRWGPRILDLDILFYDTLVFEDDRLTIPHLRLHERRFVLEPLSELAPEFVHPCLNCTVSALLVKLDRPQPVS